MAARSPEVEAYLARCRCEVSEFDPEHLVSVEFFGDTPELARELSALVLAGVKTATAGLLWDYEAEGALVPYAGAFSVFTSYGGAPLGLIRTTEVRVLPFREVDAAFAHDEGEGDRSLDDWRRGHWAFFTRRCAVLGRTPSPDLPVVCERFRLLHRA